MTAPTRKIVKLTRSRARYDFGAEPLWGADVVIEKNGRVCKDRQGQAARQATAQEIAQAKEIGPNR